MFGICCPGPFSVELQFIDYISVGDVCAGISLIDLFNDLLTHSLIFNAHSLTCSVTTILMFVSVSAHSYSDILPLVTHYSISICSVSACSLSLCISLSLSLSVCLSVCLCLSLSLSVCLSVCLSVSL